MNQDFSEVLRENVKNYEGLHHDIIKFAPNLYQLATELIHDSQIEREMRLKLLAAIGYFVIPLDLYPEEEYGAIGYVEDIMLLQHLFREINHTIGNAPLVRYWNEEPKLLAELLNPKFKSLKEAYPELYTDVIKFTGV